MTDAQWTRLGDLVPDALALPRDERPAFLDRTCQTAGGPDPDLRREAEALLDAHDEADATGWLLSPVDGLAGRVADDEQIAPGRLPERIGAWRIGGMLGEGGMGVVYRASRADGAFDREVALKRLRPGLGPDLAGRFDAERRMLARLEHPGIARLYDAGVDEHGAPFLVMERVDGQPLTDFADDAGLDVAGRVRLFASVCDAVAYAHRHLVVHRDLKPSNVFVTPEGQPKLLDFGVAKLLDDEPSAPPGAPPTVAAAMTPAYAAPEQLRGEAVTTASDVYALGVLLYELLAGRRPYDLAGQTAASAERIVCETTPPLPSAVAPPDRARALRGDLDTVVRAAMATEPSRRYPTAIALGDDLRRVLAGEPIAARPASRTYHARLFARRHRAAVLGAAAAVVALIGGLASTAWQGARAAEARDRAEARFEIARDAARALIYEVHDAVAPLDGSTGARELLLGRSVDYLDRLAADADADRPLQIDLAEAYFRIGQVQGGPNAPSLGRSFDAAESFRRGLAVLPPASRPAAGDTLGRRAEALRGRLLEKLGGVRAVRGDLAAGLRLLDAALDAFDRALAAAPGDADVLALRAGGLVNRGDYAGHPTFPNDGRPADALADYRAARAILVALPAGRRSLYAERLAGITWEREGTLHAHAGRLDDALASYRNALAIRERLAARPDADYDTRRDGGIAYETMGRTLRALGRPAEALPYFRRAHGVYQTLARADSANAGARRTLAIGHLHLASVLGGPDGAHLGRRAEARAEADRALALLRPLAARDAGDVALRDLLRAAEADREALR